MLVVDDEPAKVHSLRDLVERVGRECEIRIVDVGNAHEASTQLDSERFDLMILDIMLPLRAGEVPRSDGGMSVLRYLSRRNSAKLPNHIIGLTAYDALKAEHADEFGRDLWSVVRYDTGQSDWSEKIGRRLEHIVNSKLAALDEGYDYDLAIITALHRVELESVLALDGGWSQKRIAGDDAIYHCGTFSSKEHSLKVVAASAVEMGMCASATLSMKMISHFRPKYLAMVGIAAGVKGNAGDVLVAEQSWDYGSGKSVRAEGSHDMFLPSPSVLQMSSDLKYKHNWFSLRQQNVENIQARWKGKPMGHRLAVHIGPIASGAAVLENSDIIAQISSHNRKLIGVEMEIYGVFMAANNCVAPKPAVMAVKSICDFGDANKNDSFQSYAAFTSANYLFDFAIESLT